MSEEVTTIKVVLEGDDSSAIKAIQNTGQAVEKFTTDASGRLRDAAGKFVETGKAAEGMGDDVKAAGEQSTKTYDLMIAAANRQVSALRGGASPAVADLLAKHKDLTRAQAEEIIKTQQLADSFTKQAHSSDVAGKALSNMGSVMTTALGTFTGNLMTKAVDSFHQLIDIGVKGYSDLEQAVANISTIKPEIDNKAVFDSLNAMQTRVPQTAKELGDSLYDVFSSVNVTQKEGLQLVEQFAKGATGAGTSAQVFGTSVMGVMNAYKLSVSDAKHVSDEFFNTVNAGVVTGQQLASSLGPVTQAARSAGQSTEFLFSAIAAITKEGGEASQNINNLNNFLQKVTTTQARKHLEELGVVTADASGKFRPMEQILTDLKAKLDPLPASIRAAKLNEIFPDQQARQGATVLMAELDTLKGQLLANAKAAGVSDEAYKKMSVTFQSQSKLLQNTLQAVGTQLGAELLPKIMPVVLSFSKSLPDAIKRTHDGFVSFTHGAEEAFAPFKPLINEIIVWFKANFPELQRATGTVLRTVAEFWKQHGADIVAVIRPLILGILNLVKFVAQIINGDWKGAWKTAGDLVQNSVQFIDRALLALLGIVGDITKRAWEAAKGLGKNIWEGIVDGIKGGHSEVATAAGNLAGAATTAAKTKLDSHSPSRVFHQIGRDAGLGFINGLISMEATIAVHVAQMLKSVEEARTKVRDMVRASEREMVVSKFGENSAAVIKFDNPALPRNEAINAAATIAQNKNSVDFAAWLKQHKEDAFAAGDEDAVDQHNIIFDGITKTVDAVKANQAKDLQAGAMSMFKQLQGAMFFGQTGMTQGQFNAAAMTEAQPKSATRELSDNLLGEAQRTGRQFLATLLGGGQTNRAATLRGLLGDFQNAAIGQVSDLLSQSFKPQMEQITKGVGDMLTKTLRGVNSSVFTMLSQVYSLLSIVGAQNKKKQGGGLIGAALGGILALATGGAALPFITAGAALGSFAADPDLGGALNVAAALGGAGAFGGAGSGKNLGLSGIGGNIGAAVGGAIGGGFGGDLTRGVNVNVDLHGDINNLGGLDQMTGAIVDAVQTGLRTA